MVGVGHTQPILLWGSGWGARRWGSRGRASSGEARRAACRLSIPESGFRRQSCGARVIRVRRRTAIAASASRPGQAAEPSHAGCHKPDGGQGERVQGPCGPRQSSQPGGLQARNQTNRQSGRKASRKAIGHRVSPSVHRISPSVHRILPSVHRILPSVHRILPSVHRVPLRASKYILLTLRAAARGPWTRRLARGRPNRRDTTAPWRRCT